MNARFSILFQSQMKILHFEQLQQTQKDLSHLSFKNHYLNLSHFIILLCLFSRKDCKTFLFKRSFNCFQILINHGRSHSEQVFSDEQSADPQEEGGGPQQEQADRGCQDRRSHKGKIRPTDIIFTGKKFKDMKNDLSNV